VFSLGFELEVHSSVSVLDGKEVDEYIDASSLRFNASCRPLTKVK
jgi:hypothetical protein